MKLDSVTSNYIDHWSYLMQKANTLLLISASKSHFPFCQLSAYMFKLLLDVYHHHTTYNICSEKQESIFFLLKHNRQESLGFRMQWQIPE